jgi:hypothetical protein
MPSIKLSKDAKWDKPNWSIHIREKCKKLKKVLVFTGSIKMGLDNKIEKKD